jgi:hypothetical protein
MAYLRAAAPVYPREVSKKVSLCGQAFYTLFPLEKQGRQHPCPDTLFRTLLEACYAYGCH